MLMESTSFSSSPRPDAFPAGLRVLVVDDDPTWLKILEKMLKKCSYEVTTCCLAREALDLLRERKDGFDIVISDVNMPDMDGFKLLEHVGLEMDLPVIMMSVDGETSRVMKGVQHGACDYLLKPIRMKELRNIWQHVFRKRIHEVREIESQESIEEIQMFRNGLDPFDEYLVSGFERTSGKKRKDAENKQEDKDFGDPSSIKKARVVWTVDLHQKFVKAVNQIGFDKVGPKKILDLMSVPWLTRENVASHLQKYRLYLSRLPKENDMKAAAFGGIKHSDLSSKDPSGNLAPQNAVNTQKSDVPNSKNGSSGKRVLVQNIDSQIHEGDIKGMVLLEVTEEPKKSQTCDIPDPQSASDADMGLSRAFRSLEQDEKHAVLGSNLPLQYSWNSDAPKSHFKQEQTLHHQSEYGFDHQMLQPILQPPAPSIVSTAFKKEKDRPTDIEIKPPYAKCGNLQSRHNVPTGAAFDLFSIPSESHATAKFNNTSEPILSSTWNWKKNFGLDQISTSDLELEQGNLFLGQESSFASMDEDLYRCLIQGDYCLSDFGLQSKEYHNYIVPEFMAEAPPFFCDGMRFDYECPSESMEYPIDQGLFIA